MVVVVRGSDHLAVCYRKNVTSMVFCQSQSECGDVGLLWLKQTNNLSKSVSNPVLVTGRGGKGRK